MTTDTRQPDRVATDAVGTYHVHFTDADAIARLQGKLERLQGKTGNKATDRRRKRQRARDQA